MMLDNLTRDEQERLGMLAYKWGLIVGSIIVAVCLVVLYMHPWAQ